VQISSNRTNKILEKSKMADMMMIHQCDQEFQRSGRSRIDCRWNECDGDYVDYRSLLVPARLLEREREVVAPANGRARSNDVALSPRI
jgi:hypothetical protein